MNSNPFERKIFRQANLGARSMKLTGVARDLIELKGVLR